MSFPAPHSHSAGRPGEQAGKRWRSLAKLLKDPPGELAADPIVEPHPLVANRDPHFYGSCGSRIGKLGTRTKRSENGAASGAYFFSLGVRASFTPLAALFAAFPVPTLIFAAPCPTSVPKSLAASVT